MNSKKGVIKNVVVGTVLSIVSCATVASPSSTKVSAGIWDCFKFPKLSLSMPKIKMPKISLSFPKLFRSRSSSRPHKDLVIANPYADVRTDVNIDDSVIFGSGSSGNTGGSTLVNPYAGVRTSVFLAGNFSAGRYTPVSDDATSSGSVSSPRGSSSSNNNVTSSSGSVSTQSSGASGNINPGGLLSPTTVTTKPKKKVTFSSTVTAINYDSGKKPKKLGMISHTSIKEE